VLNAVQHNKSKAALLLGITRNTLGTKLKTMMERKTEWTIE
jgi:DNA-binding protein Fis